jgi:hypothetical protein
LKKTDLHAVGTSLHDARSNGDTHNGFFFPVKRVEPGAGHRHIRAMDNSPPKGIGLEANRFFNPALSAVIHRLATIHAFAAIRECYPAGKRYTLIRTTTAVGDGIVFG